MRKLPFRLAGAVAVSVVAARMVGAWAIRRNNKAVRIPKRRKPRYWRVAVISGSTESRTTCVVKGSILSDEEALRMLREYFTADPDIHTDEEISVQIIATGKEAFKGHFLGDEMLRVSARGIRFGRDVRTLERYQKQDPSLFS